MTYECKSCKGIMLRKQMPQVCDSCMRKGGSGADPDFNSRTDHEYGDFFISFDEEL